jgi:uncharacterized membrane protein
MKNVVIIACLLFGAFLVAVLCGADRAFSGRVGISAVFFFTALGHFAKPEEMMHMLPAGVPQRRLVILLSGIFELVLATAVLISACFRSAGLAICAFLVLATPLNIYSAIHRVQFGGHSSGPWYLAIRLPLQVLLFVWTYWFTLR